jgi:hypothetical protein
MKTKIMQGGKVVGTYDHEANTMESDDANLKTIPIEGVFAVFGNTKGNVSTTRQDFVKPGDPEFFFAFVDTLERMGYSVDQATENEYVKRRRKQRAK